MSAIVAYVENHRGLTPETKAVLKGVLTTKCDLALVLEHIDTASIRGFAGAIAQIADDGAGAFCPTKRKMMKCLMATCMKDSSTTLDADVREALERQLDLYFSEVLSRSVVHATVESNHLVARGACLVVAAVFGLVSISILVGAGYAVFMLGGFGAQAIADVAVFPAALFATWAYQTGYLAVTGRSLS